MSPSVSAPAVALIGLLQRREFRSLRTWLQRHTQLVLTAESVAQALESADQLAEADFVIVLQSWSDQYADECVHRLIGQSLFRRLFCCYSAACESDGRNRSLWPDAVRVPLRLSASVIELEIERWQRQMSAPPMTLARDEVFGYRVPSESPSDRLGSLLSREAAALKITVISPDRVLRSTIADVLSNQGADVQTRDLLRSGDLRHTWSAGPAASGAIQLVLHDLDPWSSLVEESIQRARDGHLRAAVWGLATMPDAGLATEIEDLQLPVVVPKLDLQHGLLWHLNQLLADSAGAPPAGRR